MEGKLNEGRVVFCRAKRCEALSVNMFRFQMKLDVLRTARHVNSEGCAGRIRSPMLGKCNCGLKITHSLGIG